MMYSIFSREFKDPDNPDAPEIAQEWGDYGIGRQEALTWTEAGFGPHEANAWLSQGFDAQDAAQWAEAVGKNSPEIAAMLIQYGQDAGELEDLSYQEIMGLVGEEVAEN